MTRSTARASDLRDVDQEHGCTKYCILTLFIDLESQETVRRLLYTSLSLKSYICVHQACRRTWEDRVEMGSTCVRKSSLVKVEYENRYYICIIKIYISLISEGRLLLWNIGGFVWFCIG